ncbi:hypothetical protein MFIFM68171_08054 [Madurella fahalii]|uniref:Uncharacterized protein n=1 Tax=Madurella fahalii TaxID=1157608 RepID=A0ABQ0GJA6_9PEZI
MSQEPRTPGVYGPGTYTDRRFTPVPQESERIFRLLVSQTPGFSHDEALLSKVRFDGENYPVIPGPIKAVPVAAALHAMAGVVADEILALRGLEDKGRRVTINTTHTALWLATVGLVYLGGESLASLAQQNKLKSLLPDWEHGWHSTPLKLRGTGIYRTKKPNSWYCLHGSLDIPPMLRNFGMNPDDPSIDTHAKAAAYITSHTINYTPEELELTNIITGQCGTICFTPAAWSASAMGQAAASHPLIDVLPQPAHSIPLPPTPFPSFPAGDNRPLAGIKVLSVTRIIAGPQITTQLAALGASVIRVSGPHLADVNTLQLTLTAGQRTVALDLRVDADRARVHALLAEADVFVQGFRPGRLARFGLARDDVLAAAARRRRGVVYVDESCFGRDGPYAARPGWQQIADCAAGAAYVVGRAQGLHDQGDECVLPALPVSDMTCGVVGAVGAMMALRERAVRGGSWVVSASLVRGNMFALEEEVGLYSPEVVKECQERFGWGEMRAEHHVLDLLMTVWKGWVGNELMAGYLREDGGWFQSWEKSVFGDGLKLSILRPVMRFVREDGGEQRGVTPEWKSPSVPYGWERKEDVGFD